MFRVVQSGLKVSVEWSPFVVTGDESMEREGCGGKGGASRKGWGMVSEHGEECDSYSIA